MSSHAISIRVLRKEPNNSPSKDDKIILRKTVGYTGRSDTVEVKYTDGDTNIKHVMTYPKSEIPRYIRQILILLRKDACPFSSVQFCFPAYPSIMIPVKSLCQPLIHSTILDAVRTTLMSWFLRAPSEDEDDAILVDDTASISEYGLEAPVMPMAAMRSTFSDEEPLMPSKRAGYLWGGNDSSI